jgi:hypothetical protein
MPHSHRLPHACASTELPRLRQLAPPPLASRRMQAPAQAPDLASSARARITSPLPPLRPPTSSQHRSALASPRAPSTPEPLPATSTPARSHHARLPATPHTLPARHHCPPPKLPRPHAHPTAARTLLATRPRASTHPWSIPARLASSTTRCRRLEIAGPDTG